MTVETEPRAAAAEAPAGRGGRDGRDDTAVRPFLATPVSDPPPARRLLLFTYHFPPSAMVGGLRWQKMARFAVERGWGVDVFCLHPDDVQVRDETRLGDLPNDVRVFGVRERESPAQRAMWSVARLRRRLKGMPTEHVGHNPLAMAASVLPGAAPGRPESLSRAEVMARPSTARRTVLALLNLSILRVWPHDATRLARAVAGPEHRVLVTSGPPHLVHEAGSALARELGLPHVMDMRDPWSLVERTPEPVSSRAFYRISAWLERRAVAHAALVTCNTEHAARALRRLHPQAAARIVAVMNGADEEPIPRVSPGRRFVIAYAGQVYMDRTPRALFRATARLVRELGLGPQDIGIEFMGAAAAIDGRTITDLAREEGLDGFFVMHPGRPRAEALRFLAGASLLVSLPQDSHMAIPSKVFEYSQLDAWLLAFAAPDSATGLLLQGTGADVVAPDDEERTLAVLRHHYQEHSAGVRPAPVNADGRFGRRAQAAVLLDRLDTLVR